MIRCKYFVCFFCALCVIHCELGGKITARNAKVTQSTQVCLSKTSRPLNKSTFYIRLTALRRSGYSFPPTLCFATHWAELTHPFGAVTVVSRQFRIPPWKGGKGDVHIGIMTGEHRGLPLHELPFPLPCHSEHFPCHSECQR